MQDTPYLTETLIKAIQAYGITNEYILNAFRSIPRHAFISTFFTREGKYWKPTSPDDQGWREEIYKDRSLTISLDEQGNPNVSSSQPNIMALMMQSVHIQPHQRVLEIGTGTGYNAALLASIVGAQNVVSVDINKALLPLAGERIERTVGPGVTLLHADGRALPDTIGPFDAILVTAATRSIEPSWINALQEHGRIVLNLELGLFCKIMMEASKAEGQLVGRVCTYGGDFMPLTGQEQENRRSEFPRLSLITVEEFRLHIEDQDFLFFLHINVSGLNVTRYKNTSGERSYLLQSNDGRKVLFAPFRIRGDESFWNEIQALWSRFNEQGKPGRKSFFCTTDTQGNITFSYADQTSGVCNK